MPFDYHLLFIDLRWEAKAFKHASGTAGLGYSNTIALDGLDLL